LFQRIPVATISALPSPVRSDIDIEDPPISAKARSKSVSPAIVENPKDSTSSVSIGDASARPSEAPHAATPTDTQKWKKHLYLNDGFEVEFSGFVQILEQPIPEELKQRLSRRTYYVEEGGAYAYHISSQLGRVGVNFEAAVRAGFSSAQCMIHLSDQPL